MNRHPLAACEACPLNRPDHAYVPSEGPEWASVAIVGIAPAREEAMSRRPFVGPSGRLLNAVLEEHGIKRADVFMTNTVLCRPTNPQPPKAAIACCAPRLKAELDGRHPQTIVALGNVPATAVLGRSTQITRDRVGPTKESPLFPGVRIIPTFHPAACLRGPDSFPHLVADIGKVVAESITVKWEEPKWASFNEPFLAARALDELLNGFEHFVIDIETAYEKDASFVRPNQHPLLCVGLTYMDGKAVVIGEQALKAPSVQHRLAKLLETKKLIGQNLKFDLSGLSYIGKGKIHFDTMLASYALDERQGTHGLKYMLAERYGIDYAINAADIVKVSTEELHRYNAIDCVGTWRMWQHYAPQLTGELQTLNNHLIAAANALVEVEARGFSVNESYLQELSFNLQASLEVKEQALNRWVDNPRSPLQVRAALADLGTLTDTTAAPLLRLWAEGDDEIAELCTEILRYRQEHKLYSTYVSGIEKRLVEGRCYSTFLLHGTTSGRISSRNPNLLNCPRNDKRIKRLFVPEEGLVFIQGDYAQLEARVVACLAQDAYLGEIFRNQNRDLFTELATEIFVSHGNQQHRQICKRITHGSNYGMGPGTMAMQVNNDALQMGEPNPRMTMNAAAVYQQRYLARVPQVVEWQRSIVEQVLGNGDDLVTPWGRHRRFWLITQENRYDVEHEALAFMPQSIASDICMDAFIQLNNEGLDVRLSVYDSILVAAPIVDAEQTAYRMREVMEASGRRYSSFVPFPVEIQMSATSWGDLA